MEATENLFTVFSGDFKKLEKTIKKEESVLEEKMDSIESVASKERKKGEVTQKVHVGYVCMLICKTLAQVDKVAKDISDFRVSKVRELSRFRLLMANVWIQMW